MSCLIDFEKAHELEDPLIIDHHNPSVESDCLVMDATEIDANLDEGVTKASFWKAEGRQGFIMESHVTGEPAEVTMFVIEVKNH